MITSDGGTIDSSYGIPEELASAAAPAELQSASKVRTPLWRRVLALGTLTGITVSIGVAVAIAVLGIAVLSLMLLEQAIG
jgi:hypothetical protein